MPYLTPGFPRWCSGKNPPPMQEAQETGSVPGSRRSPAGGNGSPLRSSCPGNSEDRGCWWVTVHGVANSQTEQAPGGQTSWSFTPQPLNGLAQVTHKLGNANRITPRLASIAAGFNIVSMHNKYLWVNKLPIFSCSYNNNNKTCYCILYFLFPNSCLFHLLRLH